MILGKYSEEYMRLRKQSLACPGTVAWTASTDSISRLLLAGTVELSSANAYIAEPIILPLVSREWRNGTNSSYNCTPFLHSLLTKGKL